MSFYRDVYLKSEDWRNLRAAVLHRDDYTCVRCKKRSESNDVHHIHYRNLWDVKMCDLVTFCRECHDLAHEVAESIKDKTYHPKHKWRLITAKLGISERVSADFYKDRKVKRKKARVERRVAKAGRKAWAWSFCATSG